MRTTGRRRTCKACGTPMVARRPATITPEGHHAHAAHGLCTSCYQPPSKARDDDRLMWAGLPVGDIPLPGFHRYAPPPAWVDVALCAQTDPEAFFPEKGGSIKAAKLICGECPVAALCLDYALDNGEEYGVWGGTTPADRRTLLRDRGAA